MSVLLHEGHRHSESAASGVPPEYLAALAVGLLVGAAVLSYGINRYVGR